MSGETKHQYVTGKKPGNKSTSPTVINSIKQKIDKIFTRNPLDRILNKSEEVVEEKPDKNPLLYFDYKTWVFIVIIVIFSVAMSLNTLFLKRVDLKFFTFVKNSRLAVNEIFVNYFEKPFVITIGEFETIEEAKSEAVNLLPYFKQLSIELLDSNYYVFVIDKLSSKKLAYEIAKEFKDKSHIPVKVRYLRKNKFITSK